MAAFVGNPIPSASTTLAMVEAVPIVIQCPAERFMQVSASTNSHSVIAPRRTSSLNLQTSVPEPMSCPRNFPLSIGPPEIISAGRSQLAAPINNAGVVLSQPASNTTPSIGLARIDSSTSMLTRLRKSIVVGRIKVSPSDITGNSSGNPPASYTPRFTYSASLRKCALHGVNSDQVLQMPITGRPSNRSAGKPWFFIQLRWTKLPLSSPPNHSWERSLFCLVMASCFDCSGDNDRFNDRLARL